MVIRFKARFDGSAFFPEQPIDLPKDSVVELEIVGPDTESRAEVHHAVAAAQSADKATRRLPKGDVPVQSSIAKHSSDEVSASGNK